MIEVRIYNMLASLVSNKVFPNLATQGTAAPYIVYTNVSSLPDTAICGTTRDAESLFQVDVYHNNHSDLCALRELTFAALVASPYVEAIESFSTDPEPDTGLYRALFSVRLWENAASV